MLRVVWNRGMPPGMRRALPSGLDGGVYVFLMYHINHAVPMVRHVEGRVESWHADGHATSPALKPRRRHAYDEWRAGSGPGMRRARDPGVFCPETAGTSFAVYILDVRFLSASVFSVAHFRFTRLACESMSTSAFSMTGLA